VTDEHEKPDFSQKTREMGHPEIAVCLKCGFAELTVPDRELQILTDNQDQSALEK
jgi:hypothetical protein